MTTTPRSPLAARIVFVVNVAAIGALLWPPSYREIERVLWTTPFVLTAIAAALHAWIVGAGARRATTSAVGAMLLAFALRMAGDWAVDATRHNLWPLAVAMLAAGGVVVAFPAALVAAWLRGRVDR